MNTSIKLVFSSALLFAATEFVHAATPGAYAGIGAGHSYAQDYDDVIRFDDGGFAARLFAGYNFNPYVGVEANYADFYRSQYGEYYHNYPVMIDYKSSAASLAGKLYLPLAQNKANLYAILGVAQVYTDMNIRLLNIYSSPTMSSNGLVATVGLGTSYELNQRLTVNAELSGFGEKNASEFDEGFGFPGNGLATIGLAYKF